MPASVHTCPVFYWVCTLKWDYQAVGSVYLDLKVLPGQVFIGTETRRPREQVIFPNHMAPSPGSQNFPRPLPLQTN